MNVIKFTKTRQIEGVDELKLSLLIHLVFLIALSLFFAWRRTSAQPEKKIVVPVKLISSVAKPQVTSIAKPTKQKANKTAVSPKKKIVKKITSKKPKSKVVSKTTAKSVAKPVKQTQTLTMPKIKVKSEIDSTVNTSNKTEITTTKLMTGVIQKSVKGTMPIKPVHNNPTFEKVANLTPEKTSFSTIDPKLPTLEMNLPTDELMPNSFLEEEKEVAMPNEFISTPTDIESSENKNVSGLFEIASIESFSANNENFTAPAIISKVLPEYPEWARKKGIHGIAVYRVLIQQSGTVSDVVTMSSTVDPKLAISGAQALRRWVFTPVLLNGEPQETWVKITLQYQLD